VQKSSTQNRKKQLCTTQRPITVRGYEQGQKLMLQRVFKRAYRSGLALYECDLEALAEEAQYNLFRNSLSDNHCLNLLYFVNTKPEGVIQLRDRGHHFALPLFLYNWILTKNTLLLVHCL